MKKTFLVASAVVAVLASSCSKNEVTQTNPGDAIAFKAFSSGGTKATEATNNDVLSFTVHGTAETTASYNFVDTYTRTSSTESWVPALGEHYWPAASENMTFVAYSPALSTNPFYTVQDAQGPAVTEEMTITNISPYPTAAQQKDFMVANVTANSGTSSGSVTLPFQHALSQIIVQAKNSNSKVVKVEVFGVKVGSVSGNATLTLPTTSTESGQGGLAWSTTADSKTSYMAGGADQTYVELTADPRNIMFNEGGFMLIPQQLTAWASTDATNAAGGAYLSVLCKVYNNNSASAESPTWTQVFPSNGKMGFLAVPIDTNWEPGKKYTYTLEFYGENGGGGLPDPDPVDPTDPDGGDIDTNPNDPVGGEITFSVSVANWLPGETVNKPMP